MKKPSPTMRSINSDLMRSAATSGPWGLVRAFLFNPGFSVTLRYRLACRLRRHGGLPARGIARLVWLSNVRTFGCYMSRPPGLDRDCCCLILSASLSVTMSKSAIMQRFTST